MNNKSHFLKCSCTCQILEAEFYDYGDWDTGVNFSIWARSRSDKKLCLRERFRWCWRILTTGSPWADNINATHQDAYGLAKFILKNLPSEEFNEKTK